MTEPSPRVVSVRVPAKINLHLGVGTVRPDGFHPLATVYQAISLYSTITVRPADHWSVTCQAAPDIAVDQVPLDDTNLAMRAAHLLAERAGVTQPVSIHIDKGIPVAGGLAGGSADAAATLLACDRFWGLNRPDLAELAAELGSDVPFSLIGGTASGLGRGELVQPLTDSGRYDWVVLTFDEGLSTPAVYREYDVLHDGLVVSDPEIPQALLDALAAGSVAGLADVLSNDLQSASLELRPALAAALQAGLDASALAGLVSGSGPTCLFLCNDSDHAGHVAHQLKAYGQVFTAHGPVPGTAVL